MILSAVCFCVSCADITVFSFGRYYLESMHVDEGGSPSPYFHRLDDIADPVVTGKPLSDREKVESLRAAALGEIGMSKRLRRSKMRNPPHPADGRSSLRLLQIRSQGESGGNPRETTRACR